MASYPRRFRHWAPFRLQKTRQFDTLPRRSYTLHADTGSSEEDSMLKRFVVILLIAASATLGFAEDNRKVHQPKLTPQSSGTTQLLIAVSPVNSRVVWAVERAGRTWLRPTAVRRGQPVSCREPRACNCDVQGVNDKVAYSMSIGNNTTDFRIYKTERRWCQLGLAVHE